MPFNFGTGREASDMVDSVRRALSEGWRRPTSSADVTIERRDARLPSPHLVDSVVTSPPYPGVYDYMATARKARSEFQLRSATSDLGSFLSPLPPKVEGDRDTWPDAWADHREMGSYQAYKVHRLCASSE